MFKVDGATHDLPKASTNRQIVRASPGQGDGGARRDRTDDLLLAKQALSQLSYGPLIVGIARRCSQPLVWLAKEPTMSKANGGPG